MRAIDLATRRVVTMQPEQSLREASQMMQQHLVGCIVVTRADGEGLLPLGLVTDRDLSRIALAGGFDNASLTVDTIMSRPLVLCPQDASLAQIVCIMHGSGFRRLPVVDDEGHLLGIVTADDAIVGVSQLLQQLTEVLVVEPALKDKIVAIQCTDDARGNLPPRAA